jgi:hypothetical protein
LSQVPPRQEWPQLPQFWGSVCTLVQAAPQRLGLLPPQVHWYVLPLGVHVSPLPQLLQPQVWGAEMLVSQPLSGGLEPQWPKPVTHEDAGITQWPLWQDTVAPGLTLASWPQSWPQLPQFRESLCRLMHWPLQVSGVPAAQPQANDDPEAAHTFPVSQRVVQPPQVSGREKSVSQPSSERPLQSAQPVAHEPEGITQAPPVQETGAPARRCASWPQSWPQVAQLRGSLRRSVQVVPHLSGVGPEQALTHW